jgi:hypothetical protein
VQAAEPKIRQAAARGQFVASNTRRTFLVLILVQACHSIEEYVFRLYEVFEPARVISNAISSDAATGFALVNTAIVAFGFWCHFARVRTGSPSATRWILPWILVELANGVMHPTLAVVRGGYFPGTITAPLLLVVAACLAYQSWSERRVPAIGSGA